MATHVLSHFSVLIYSSPVRAWLGPDNSETAWRADTTPRRVIQAIITPSKKHGNAGKLKKLLSKCHTPFNTVSERCGPAASWPDKAGENSGPSVLVIAVLEKKDICVFSKKKKSIMTGS